MSKILVNIVGGQTQPNILMAKEIHHLYGTINQLVLVYSQFTEKQFKLTQQACVGLTEEVVPIMVNEDDIIDIQNKLTNNITFEDGDELFVNITGGTKIMSIGVYDFFVKYSARIFYVVLGKNTYNQVFPRVKNKVNHFRYSLNLEEYLKGYGVNIANPDSLHRFIKEREVTTDFFEKVRLFEQKDWEAMDLIRQGFNGTTYRGKNIARKDAKSQNEQEIRDKIFNLLAQIEFPLEKQDNLSRKETKYLTGDWFEEYVYWNLKESLNLDEAYFGMGLQIRIGENETVDVPNELDLALMLRNELHIIECKTRLITTNGSNILTDTLYKVDSLRTKFGLNVKASIFTLASEDEVKRGIPRGKLNNINIVSFNQIHDRKFLNDLFRI